MTFTDPDAPRLFYGILTSIDDQKPKTNNMHEKGAFP